MLIHLQLNTVRVKPPISHTAAAFKSTFGGLDGPFDASGATDHDTLLQAPKLVTVPRGGYAHATTWAFDKN
jgi:hypothetical protein